MTDKKTKSGEEIVTLAHLADHLKLTKGTVSAVLNDSPYAKSIPQRTKDRIFAAAEELNYRPNFFARTLRKKRTYTIGVVAEEIGDPYGSMVISGIESVLSKKKYFFLTVIHRHNPELLQQYLEILVARGVEGLITVDTVLKRQPKIPTIVIPGHIEIPGVTNLVLDHRRAAELALKHLIELGHKEIAVFKGQEQSSDSQQRWLSICNVAREFGVPIKPELTVQLSGDDPSPQLGYVATQELFRRNSKFTALFAYNDISSIGAIRAIIEKGLRVPEDISVVGFDDIREAAFHHPGITTVRQPLRKMGEIAATTVIERIEGEGGGPERIEIEPELIVRESTGPANVVVKTGTC